MNSTLQRMMVVGELPTWLTEQQLAADGEACWQQYRAEDYEHWHELKSAEGGRQSAAVFPKGLVPVLDAAMTEAEATAGNRRVALRIIRRALAHEAWAGPPETLRKNDRLIAYISRSFPNGQLIEGWLVQFDQA